MKKLLAILLAVLMVAAVFTACGEEEKKDNNDSSVSETSKEESSKVESSYAESSEVESSEIESSEVESSEVESSEVESSEVESSEVESSEVESDSDITVNTDVVGKYFIESMTMDGETYGKDMLSILGVAGSYIEFMADGTGVIFFEGEDEPEEFTYDDKELSDDTDVKIPYSFDGEKLTLDYDGVVFVFSASNEEDTSTEESSEAETSNIVIGDITGKYLIDSMISGGVTYGKDVIAAAGMDGCYIELKADGTGVIFLDEEYNITYDESGITDETGETIPYTFDGTSLSITYESNTLVFVAE